MTKFTYLSPLILLALAGACAADDGEDAEKGTDEGSG